jgi:hypothetical protein
VFNVPGDPVPEIVGSYRQMLEALARDGAVGQTDAARDIRQLLGAAFTRGHFVRAV